MKKKTQTIIFFILISLILILTFTLTSASDGLPDGYTAFYPSNNLVCLDQDGEFLGCWCCPDGEDCEIIDPTPGPKPTNTPREPNPSDTPKSPDPTDTPKPEKTKKSNCNCGGGNQGEGCNPNPNCDEKKNDKQDE